jgi:tetratricopeptide (TPR) repeat protein
MKNLLFIFLLTIVLGGCSVFQPLQKRKLIAVFHLIETAKYADAKVASEELINDKEAAQWPKTWYARGVLSQNAYREGIKKNDKKLSELYPDQLYVARQSFDKALALDKAGRMERQLAPRYVLLANDFQILGERHFRNKKYEDALRAFEQALEISEKPVLMMQADTNLVYNTALAAFESKNWNKAIGYFGRLHDEKHSANVAHLLFEANFRKGDTLAARKVLTEGIASYDDNQDLVLLLADFFVSINDTISALQTLDRAIASNPQNPTFHYAKGLIYQKSGRYSEAIRSYNQTVNLAPGDLMAHVNMATCYYNIGVEIEENARAIMDISVVREEKERSEEAFKAAEEWLDKAYQMNPADQELIGRLYELYKSLRITDKADILERRIE